MTANIETDFLKDKSRVVTFDELIVLLKEVANLSPCKKRKVGCLIAKDYKDSYSGPNTVKYYHVLAYGYNFHPDGEACEIITERNSVPMIHTDPKVIHAEINAIDNFYELNLHGIKSKDCYIFVSHEPCSNCRRYIQAAGFKEPFIINLEEDTMHKPVPHENKVTTNIDNVLAERGNRYGKFEDHAKIAQDLKAIMQATPGWQRLNPMQKEALEMNAHKTARILNGDPNYKDSWTDIIGYTKLVEDTLE